MSTDNSVLPFFIYLIKLRNAGGLEHSDSTTIWAVQISERLGLPAETRKQIEFASRVHDVGKVGIHESVLTKPGCLTQNEYDAIKDHVTYGAELLRLLRNVCTEEITDDAIRIVNEHHENYDGTGYLKGLKGDDIHIGARVIRVADTIAAMTTSYRIYRAPLTQFQAFQIMMDHRQIYDPLVFQAFYEVQNER